MQILWLKSDLLLPLDKGGKLRTWHLLRHLAGRHETTYLAFADPDELAQKDGMRAVARSVETIPRIDRAKRSLAFYAGVARLATNRLPYAVAKYQSRAFGRRVRALLAERRFDVIVCDFIFPAVNLPADLPCASVLFTHNVEAEIWRRHAETQTNPITKHLYGIQHRRMQRFEAETLARFDGVLAVSDQDRATFYEIYPGIIKRPIHVVPTGVDTTFFSRRQTDGQPGRLVFTGSMDWLPNEDAMVYFCREILEKIRRQEPTATLSIVGRAPTPVVQRLADIPGVTVTGRVDDVRPFLAEGDVYVVPLRIGGGTRLKIFEAMAMGKPIVSTSIGAEGLSVTDGQHLLIADSPDAFAQRVVDLMRNPARKAALADQGHRLVLDRFDWSAVAGGLEQALLRVVAQHGRTAAPAAAGPADHAAGRTPWPIGQLDSEARRAPAHTP